VAAHRSAPVAGAFAFYCSNGGALNEFQLFNPTPRTYRFSIKLF
jgi:hypothetical protein